MPAGCVWPSTVKLAPGGMTLLEPADIVGVPVGMGMGDRGAGPAQLLKSREIDNRTQIHSLHQW